MEFIKLFENYIHIFFLFFRFLHRHKTISKNYISVCKILFFLKKKKMADRNKTNEIVFTPAEFEQVSKYLIGSQIRPYPNVIVPQSNGPARVQPKEELMMVNVMESCVFKSVMSFVVGGALGGFIGLFSSSIGKGNKMFFFLTTRWRLSQFFKNLVKWQQDLKISSNGDKISKIFSNGNRI